MTTTTQNTIQDVSQIELYQKQMERQVVKSCERASGVRQKDIVTKADLSSSVSTPTTSSPTLSVPSMFGSQVLVSDNMSLIGIMNLALTLQMKTQSNYWNMAWQTASQSMQQYIAYAPVIADATINEFNAQAAQSTAQANQALGTGTVSLIFGAAAIGMASMSGPESAEDIAAVKPDAIEDEVADNVAGNAQKAAQQQAAADVDAEAAAAADPENIKPADEVMQAKESGSGTFKNGMKKLSDWINRFAGTANGFQLLSTGITSYIQAHYQSAIADQQKVQGQEKAQADQTQMFAQYQQMAFNRTEETRQGAGQNIDSMFNLLNNFNDNLAQTTRSMFQG